jgi:AsmA protein
MKKLILILLILAVIVAAVVGIFLATFDADRYRPMLVERMEQALGRPVQLARISLEWRGGLALRLKELKIAGAAGQEEPALQVELVSAVVRLLPLLGREIQVSSLIISQPRMRVVRTAQGGLELIGPAAVAGPAASSGKTVNIGGAPVGFQISSLRIDDGAVHWIDQMAQPPVDLRLSAIDLTLRNVSMTRPIDVDASLAAFSDQQNVHVQGRLRMPQPGQPGVIEGLTAKTDLSQLRLNELLALAPALRQLGLQEGLAGTLEVSCERLPLDPSRLASLEATARLVNGRIALARLGTPLEDLQADVAARADRLELRRLSARFAGGAITLSGAVEQLSSQQPRISLDAAVDKLELATALPQPAADQAQVRGIFSLAFQGAASGRQWPELSQTLSGSGRVGLQDGVIENFNLLHEVFHRISIIPGLVDLLMARLSASYQEKFSATDTVLKPVDLSLAARNGTLAIDQFRIGTDTAELDGAASVSLADWTVASRPMLRIDPEMSAAIIKSVNELRSLTDTQGRLELPVIIRLPQLAFRPDSVLPDLNYLASRLIVSKTQELIGDFLEKALDRGSSPSAEQPSTGEPDPGAPGSQPEMSPEGLLDQFLRPLEPRR